MSPVPWRIVKLRDGYVVPEWPSTSIVTAEAPPEVVPAVWTHEGCETCGGSGLEPASKNLTHHLRPCPDGRLVPWEPA